MIQVLIQWSPLIMILVVIGGLTYMFRGHIDDDPSTHADDTFLNPYGEDHMNPFWTDDHR